MSLSPSYVASMNVALSPSFPPFPPSRCLAPVTHIEQHRPHEWVLFTAPLCCSERSATQTGLLLKSRGKCLCQPVRCMRAAAAAQNETNWYCCAVL